MPVKVIIKRKFPQPREKELLPLLQELRVTVPKQPGYISSEYFKRTDRPNEQLIISTWHHLEDWNRWVDSKERYAIQSKIEAVPGVTTEFAIYTSQV